MDNEKRAEAYNQGVLNALEEYGLLKKGQVRPMPPIPKKTPPAPPKNVPLPGKISPSPTPAPPKNLLQQI